MKDLYRKTYAKINLSNIKENVSKVVNKFDNYDYYFGVVKADCYGHGALESIQSIIDGGCNYLAVATLEEALSIREKFNDIPILCLGIIPCEYIDLCVENNITVTVSSYDYALELVNVSYENLKVHVKINTGMNRLGIATFDEFKKTIDLLWKNNVVVEGVYSHIFNASDVWDTNTQFDKYQEIIGDIDKSRIPIFHISASAALISYKKLDFVNGCRLGIIMYGFTTDKDLNLKSTFSLHSRVIQINNLKKGDKVGYNGIYVAEGSEKIAVVPVGYADGVIRKNTGRDVYINGKRFPIVGNVCMDMLFVKIDDSVKVNDEVVLLKDIEHIEYVADYLETIPYEVLCSVGKRVPRIYVN
ncbi:MAG: alanine racemase [Bacilli bacterium]